MNKSFNFEVVNLKDYSVFNKQQNKDTQQLHVDKNSSAVIQEYLDNTKKSGFASTIRVAKQQTSLSAKEVNPAREFLSKAAQDAEHLINPYASHTLSGNVEAKRQQSVEATIDSNDKEVKKLLNVKSLFDEAKRDKTSIIYMLFVEDLCELNAVSKQIYDSDLSYSEKINEYYKEKFGRELFNRLRDYDLIRHIDSKEFPKYYEYGYNSQIEPNKILKYNQFVMQQLVDVVYDDQKRHIFDMTRQHLAESSNVYNIEKSTSEIQRTVPYVRKTQHTHGSTSEPDWKQILQHVNTPKKKVR